MKPLKEIKRLAVHSYIGTNKLSRQVYYAAHTDKDYEKVYGRVYRGVQVKIIFVRHLSNEIGEQIRDSLLTKRL